MQISSFISVSMAMTSLGLLLSGCAAEPIVTQEPAPIISGEQMLRESQGIANLGDRWKSGKKLSEQGAALVREGQNKVDEGRRMIDEGEKIMRESENNYKSIKK